MYRIVSCKLEKTVTSIVNQKSDASISSPKIVKLHKKSMDPSKNKKNYGHQVTFGPFAEVNSHCSCKKCGNEVIINYDIPRSTNQIDICTSCSSTKFTSYVCNFCHNSYCIENRSSEIACSHFYCSKCSLLCEICTRKHCPLCLHECYHCKKKMCINCSKICEDCKQLGCQKCTINWYLSSSGSYMCGNCIKEKGKANSNECSYVKTITN